MQVNQIVGEIARTEAFQRVQAPSSAPAPSGIAPDEASVGGPRADDVHISDQGRALASSTVSGDEAVSDIGALRANALRTKIFTGAYNTLDSAEQVARAIIRSGDF